jgi:hypothetical protein
MDHSGGKMRKRKVFLSIVVLLCQSIWISNCKKVDIDCGQRILVDFDMYRNAPADDFDFVAAEVVGDCLRLTIRYGGGCGNIDLKLIDGGFVWESFPHQRSIRLSLKDEDECEALVTKEVSFDLTPIRVTGVNLVVLNLAQWNAKLLYRY